MDKLKILKNKSDKEFLRIFGIKRSDFDYILSNLEIYLDNYYLKYPLKRRGLKSNISLGNQLLLTFYYLRHYMTFLKLGEEFGISESYAYKIYNKTSKHLLSIFRLKSDKELLSKDLKGVIIDVSEQPIERPKKKQKTYYSGKKNDIR
jgi:hypothetical protein